MSPESANVTKADEEKSREEKSREDKSREAPRSMKSTLKVAVPIIILLALFHH